MTSRTEHGTMVRVGMSVLVILATILGLVLMHSMVGGEHASAPHTMSTMSEHAAGSHESASTTATSVTSVAGCGDACEMLCGLMGMACVMILILSAVAWLRRSPRTVLFVLSRLVSGTAGRAHDLVPRRPVSRAALAVYRI